MTKVYLIKFSMAAGGQQPELMQALKTKGAEVIQTSAGLCAKTDLSESELKAAMKEFGESVSIETLTQEKLKDEAESVKAFVRGH
jgi:D-ribose pyranose/furanose isomerase RbsD